MKVIPLGQAKNELSACVDEAQHDRVLITRHGRPAALLIGVEGEELEDLMTRANPRFWEMIESRRHDSTTVSSDELRKRLKLERKPARKQR